jgi:glutathione S-transferase
MIIGISDRPSPVVRQAYNAQQAIGVASVGRRLIDNYIHLPFQQVVNERMRPEGQHDPFGADQSRGNLRRGYDLVAPMIADLWAMGETFTLADYAALPALYYAHYAVSLAGWPELEAYLERLKIRPSVARVLQEAQPSFKYFPLANDR